MIFREAVISDIPQIQEVRHSVVENILSDPKLVTDDDCKSFITERGRGWVCETKGKIVGFAIADLQEKNLWALFVRPEFEHHGIGLKLQDLMMHWYFAQTSEPVWLSTEAGTRAERFYRQSGWMDRGAYGNGEIKFEMTAAIWLDHKKK